MPKEKIVIVENEKVIAMEIQSRLEELEYVVPALYASGEEAIENMVDLAPDLVLMDIRLDGKLDGIQTAEQVRDRLDIPIIFLTAYADEDTLARAKITEPYGYILKPFTEQELHASIKMALYRHKIETEIISEKNWVSFTLKSIGDAVIATDTKAKITFMNPAAESITKWSQKEAIGKNVTEIFKLINEKQNRSQRDPILKVLQEGTTSDNSDSTILIDRNGTETYIDKNIAPIKDDRGNIKGAVIIFKDAAKRIIMNRMKDDFVSNVSHELRTPLTIIRESVAQVRDGITGEVNDEQKRFLSLSIRNTDRLQRMVDDLLDISKIESGKVKLEKKKENLNELVKSITDPFVSLIKKQGLDFKVLLPENPIDVFVDKDRIVQVLNNLIGNALKFTEKGTIQVDIESENEHINCSVRDTGIGIKPEFLPKVFEKFEQFESSINLKQKGSGLGLAITKEIIHLHNGEISAQSKPSVGSTFTFTLPKYVTGIELLDKIGNQILDMKYPFIMFYFQIHNYPDLTKQIGNDNLNSSYEKMKFSFENSEKNIHTLVGETNESVIFIEKPLKKELKLKNLLVRTIKEAFIESAPELELDFSYNMISAEEPLTAETLLKNCKSHLIREKEARLNKNILIVDDEIELTEATKTLIEFFGYTNIGIANTGEAAFESIQKALPELIILDMKMPGMSGYEVIGRLKENFETKDIPILIMSGYEVETGRFHEYINKKAILTINKPVDEKLLRKMIYYLI